MENVQAHTDRTSPAQLAQRYYSAQFIADENQDLNVKEVTIRTRWFDWATKVAPHSLLRNAQGKFTELGRDLLNNYAQRVKRDNIPADDWVLEAKSHYSQEWESEGILEGELMPGRMKRNGLSQR
jgi:hypothetical protein